MLIIKTVSSIGKKTLALCTALGTTILFLTQSVSTLFNTRLRIHTVFTQMEVIGIKSLGITVITCSFAGAVMAIQAFRGFKEFGGEGLLGPVIAISVSREIAPVLTGFMVTARAGSAIAAEIGTMAITEQLDALRTLNINIFQYLVVPRVLAATLALPILTATAMLAGVTGGYLVSVGFLGLTPEQFIDGIKEIVEPFDIAGGLIKGAVFGVILSWISCYKGYMTRGGALGVGRATTQAVVVSSMLIIVSNYFLAMVLFGIH